MWSVLFSPSANFNQVVPRLVADRRGSVLHLGGHTSHDLCLRTRVGMIHANSLERGGEFLEDFTLFAEDCRNHADSIHKAHWASGHSV
jgi:hypothetical protein